LGNDAEERTVIACPSIPRTTPALDRAAAHARSWLTTLPDRPVPFQADADAARARLGESLPEDPADPAEVVDTLAGAVEPGLLAIPSGRFYGWVMGGTLPAALAADWLTSATFTGPAAARHHLLDRVGWDDRTLGLTGAPRIRVLTGAERHESLLIALRYLGLGAPIVVPVDEQGRVRAEEMRTRLLDDAGPTIVCLQAGNLHSGAFDAIAEITAIAHEHAAWVHVDGAFGLWAAASPRLRHLVTGLETADSWATDAHKTLNVPYDSGVSVVAYPEAVRAAMGVRGAYLLRHATEPDPFDTVPEMSRRAGGVPVWAALRSLGRARRSARRERPKRSLPASARSTAPRCSMMSFIPRFACHSVMTPVRKPWPASCSRTAPSGCPALDGEIAPCSASRSATGRRMIRLSDVPRCRVPRGRSRRSQITDHPCVAERVRLYVFQAQKLGDAWVVGAPERVVGVRVDRRSLDRGETVPGEETSVERQRKQAREPELARGRRQLVHQQVAVPVPAMVWVNGQCANLPQVSPQNV
jgi:hypothetical protein